MHWASCQARCEIVFVRAQRQSGFYFQPLSKLESAVQTCHPADLCQQRGQGVLVPGNMAGTLEVHLHKNYPHCKDRNLLEKFPSQGNRL